jgi:hypothetical protein
MNTEFTPKLNLAERTECLKQAHQRYVDWWLPIDVAGGSFLAPTSFHGFCRYLLVANDTEWFDRWLPEFIETNEKYYMKQIALSLVLENFTKKTT